MATTVTISKTIQVRQYEPLVVTISRTIDDAQDTKEQRVSTIKEVGALVEATLQRETKRYLRGSEGVE